MASFSVDDLPGIGAKTAERLEENHGILTAGDLSIAFFGNDGKAVSDTLYSPLKIAGPLYRETRESVPNSAFGLDKSRYRAIDVMMFARVFGVSAEWLIDDYFTSYDISSKYSLSPDDFVWSNGCVTNEKNTVGYAYWGIPWDFQEEDWGAAKEVKSKDGLVEFSRGEAATCVKRELLEGIERITGKQYEENGVGDVQVHRENDGMPVFIYDSGIPGRYMIAPRITP